MYLPGTTIHSIRCVLQTFNSLEYDHSDIDKETATKYIDMCFTIFKQMVEGNMGSRVDLERKVFFSRMNERTDLSGPCLG